MKEPMQFFFGKEEGKLAIAAAKEHNETLFEIVDKRSKNPTARMYVLTFEALEGMYDAKMMKRMWTYKQVCWQTPKTVEDTGYIGRGPDK